MRKTTVVWICVAMILILFGCFIFGGVMTVLKWDFKKLSTSTFETNNYVLDEEFKSIFIDTNVADITFVPSENTEIVCYEQQNLKHSVSVKDGYLVIEVNDSRKWYDYFISLRSPKITLYLPQGSYSELKVNGDTGAVSVPKEFSFESVDISVSTGFVSNFASASGNIKIKTSTGNVLVENVRSKNLEVFVTTGKAVVASVDCEDLVDVRVSTGDADISDVTCQSFKSEGATGDIFLKNTVATADLSVNRSTGDVKFERCDASEIFVKTNTGSVTGTFLTDKIFIAKSDTGKVQVPSSVSGGKCEISTNTGEVKISIED